MPGQRVRRGGVVFVVQVLRRITHFPMEVGTTAPLHRTWPPNPAQSHRPDLRSLGLAPNCRCPATRLLSRGPTCELVHRKIYTRLRHPRGFVKFEPLVRLASPAADTTTVEWATQCQALPPPPHPQRVPTV